MNPFERRLLILAWVAILAAWYGQFGPSPVAAPIPPPAADPGPAEVRRQTWCQTPEQRAGVDPPPPAEVDEPALTPALDLEVPARGADVTPIVGASLLSPEELAREINRLILSVSPGVEIRSVSLAWREREATLVVAWERRRPR